MEIFVFLILVILIIGIAMVIGGVALTTGDDRPTERSIRETGERTRAKIGRAAREHKQQSFDYLYKKHQENIDEVLHE